MGEGRLQEFVKVEILYLASPQTQVLLVTLCGDNTPSGWMETAYSLVLVLRNKLGSQLEVPWGP